VAGLDRDEFDSVGDARMFGPWDTWPLALAAVLVVVIVGLVLSEVLQLRYTVSTIGPDRRER
jgi:hypothetical protein